MAEIKKYYWLKLKEDFFDDDTMQWIEERPNGKEYELFYLKLCLKSLKCDGILIRSVGNMLIPYDAKKISELTRTDIDTVNVSMDLFKKIGLVQVLENGEIYLTQLQNMVGSESKWAKYKRKNNELENLQSDSKAIPKKLQTEIEKENRERDKETDIEIKKEKENTPTEPKSNKKSLTPEEKQQVEDTWKLYPEKKGKAAAIKKIPKILKKYGFEQLQRCIERYKQYVTHRQHTDFRDLKYQNGSTFFNGTYIDYLDENWKEGNDGTNKRKFEEPEEGQGITL